MIKIGLFCCCKCYEKANLVIFCKWQNKRWKCCGHPAIKMKSCHLQRMKKKKRIFSYNHLVLLALAVLLAFQAIERMCGPFGWIFMPHRWDFSNIHNKEILMQRIWTILNSFWLLHILMKLGSLIKWMGMLPANTEFLKRKTCWLEFEIYSATFVVVWKLNFEILLRVEKNCKGHYRILLKESLWNWTWSVLSLMSGKVQQMKLEGQVVLLSSKWFF